MVGADLADGEGEMRTQWVGEMFVRYGELLCQEAWYILGALMLGSAALFMERRFKNRDGRSAPPRSSSDIVRYLILAGVLCTGLWFSIEKASVFDDAYISFRYVDNFLSGKGLIWNPGERVEGYTNFLWVLVLAAGTLLTKVELPLVALISCLLAYVAGVAVFASLERRLFGVGIPLATALFALQNTTTDYATSGLETGFATFCMMMGLRSLMSGSGKRHATTCGMWLIASTMCRPDHGIFWIAGGLSLLVQVLRRSPSGWPKPERPSKRGLLTLSAYAATFAPYGLYLLWKLSYYGSLLPNTYYAKSANLTYFSQGGIYALSFLLGAHLWVLIPLAIIGLLHPTNDSGHRCLKVFSAVALVLYNFYVLKVGGDFMYGRFYLVTIPLWLLLARLGVAKFAATRRWKGALAAGVFVATIGGVNLFSGASGQWYLNDESRTYQVTQWLPHVVIEHHNWRGGTHFGEYLQQRGVEPILATTGIGMIGYYSRLEVIDMRGLTDKVVARTRLKRRRMPGHEKYPRQKYLDRRKIHFVRSQQYHPERWRKTTEIDIGAHKKRRQWHFYRYDSHLADQLEELAPEVKFVRFEPVLDSWLYGRRPRTLESLEEDAAFFEQYYFCCNDDPERKERFDAIMVEARGEEPATLSTADVQ